MIEPEQIAKRLLGMLYKALDESAENGAARPWSFRTRAFMRVRRFLRADEVVVDAQDRRLEEHHARYRTQLERRRRG